MYSYSYDDANDGDSVVTPLLASIDMVSALLRPVSDANLLMLVALMKQGIIIIIIIIIIINTINSVSLYASFNLNSSIVDC
jgi:hypothetical protein